jgi:hypothetical protein
MVLCGAVDAQMSRVPPFWVENRTPVVIAAFCVALSCLSRRMLRGVKPLWPRQYAFDISSELERTRGI